MKKLTIAFLATCLCISVSSAQLYRSVNQGGNFSQSIENIIRDYPSNFIHIQKELLSSEPDFDVYASGVSLSGSSNCVIKRYHSKYDSSASWQATMYEGDDLEHAKKVYRNTCKSMQRARINLNGFGGIGFKGEMVDFTTNISFAESVYQLKLKDELFETFFAEVELVSTGMYEFAVHLSLYNKKKDDEK